MDNLILLKKWLEIEYYHIGNKIGLINQTVAVEESLVYDTIRLLDSETTMNHEVDVNTVIALLALMWEYIDHEKYDIRDFIIKILSRIGYPTSAIIADKEFEYSTCSFSDTNSIFDRYTLTLNQTRNEIMVGEQKFLLTQFQKELWESLNSKSLLGISAPTSAGKSFVILLNTINKMLNDAIDVIYIVPTLSLLNQVTEDYNNMLKRVGIQDFLITNNLSIGESTAAHTVYVWTQEKAISSLSLDIIITMPKKTILVVDEIQNIERVSDDSDVRAKILYDTLQELRHIDNVIQIIISGPRINEIDELGKSIFGKNTVEVSTRNSPVLSLTYSIRKMAERFYLKQYCGILDTPFVEEITNSQIIGGYGSSAVSDDYISFLYALTDSLRDNQNIIFAPTSKASRDIAQLLSNADAPTPEGLLFELIEYYKATVNENYTLCLTLKSGIAYHHGKLPIHVRRTIEKAIRDKMVTNVVCTTTLMQGVNLPAQNIIIRNPHLYTRHHSEEAELTHYEMANLRGRAGRLLKDFIGRTFVLDESEFEDTDGYDQISLFDDVSKNVPTGYEEKFLSFREDIINAVESQQYVDENMSEYGHLVTYIRQSILKHGKNSRQRMAETGVTLTSKQVAAIIAKLNTLSIPKQICLHNRYWDPFVLDDVYRNFKGKVPNHPTERGARNRLSDLLKFIRDNNSTKEMYKKYIPSKYQQGSARGLLCSTCIKWASEMPLSEILSGKYFEGSEAPDHIEDTIKLLHETVSFKVPLLIKPIIEIKNEKSSIVTCLQSGAYNPYTRKMIEIGVPRELAIKLTKDFFSHEASFDTSSFEFEKQVREKIRSAIPDMPYWEQVQLSFLQ